jgi:hypothetical protein
VLPHDLAEFIKMFVKRILSFVCDHPFCGERSAAADDSRNPTVGQRQMLQEQPGVDRHVVDALLRLVFHGVEKLLRLHIDDVVELFTDLIQRHRPDRHGHVVDDPLPQNVDVGTGRQVHDGIRSVLDGVLDLGDFAEHVSGER